VKRGRPRLSQEVKVVQVKLRLYRGSDDDLIAFFESISRGLRSAVVKRALRSGTTVGADVTDASDETLDALDTLVS
jgi:hypothetical protein